jgi:hypothetical protein
MFGWAARDTSAVLQSDSERRAAARAETAPHASSVGCTPQVHDQQVDLRLCIARRSRRSSHTRVLRERDGGKNVVRQREVVEWVGQSLLVHWFQASTLTFWWSGGAWRGVLHLDERVATANVDVVSRRLAVRDLVAVIREFDEAGLACKVGGELAHELVVKTEPSKTEHKKQPRRAVLRDDDDDDAANTPISKRSIVRAWLDDMAF